MKEAFRRSSTFVVGSVIVTTMNIADEIARLHELRSGALSDEEFAATKERFLLQHRANPSRRAQKASLVI